MTTKVLNFCLRKVERQLGDTSLSRLSDEALNAAIRGELDQLSRPFNGNLVATADTFRVSSDPEAREIARHLDDIAENWSDLYPLAG